MTAHRERFSNVEVVVVDVLIWVFVTLLILVVVSIATVFLIVRALVKRIRRSRAIAGGVLRTRARFSSGPHGKVLRLRVRLEEILASGKAAVDLAARGDGPRGELPELFRRIEHEGAALDLQLRLMESETDSAVLAEELRAAGLRVEQVAGLVRRLRSAVALGLEGVTDDTLTTLRSDVDREVAALHAGVQELRTLNRDGLVDPTGHQPTEASTVRDKGTRP
ncbi:hypothetical protein [Agromyces sp. Soil535]|uniref:hypothetical protein n=1 Tax=Agromyces sp. Soil535 TaxID=1736390 RepID=UPI0007007846|nr:hypothetical protein [Agromyces sp. Soil535]KRE25778.1 hypothetical protein ASG80_22075 [Agromyces sp. Soil535]